MKNSKMFNMDSDKAKEFADFQNLIKELAKNAKRVSKILNKESEIRNKRIRDWELEVLKHDQFLKKLDEFNKKQ